MSSSPYKHDQLWCLIKDGDWKKFWQVFDQVKNIDKEFKEIFEAMVNKDPKKRCNVSDVLGHKYF